MEKATEAGCEPVPNVTSLFLRNSRKKKRELITADSVDCVPN